MFDLYVITDPSRGDALIDITRRALLGTPPGRIALQLRLKPWTPQRRREAAQKLRELTASAGAALIVNGEPALAREVGADGVQLPEDGPSVADARSLLGPGASIGASCHDGEGLGRAQARGADFATLSPFHGVADKGPPLQREQATEWMRRSALPVLALGGITPARAVDAIAAGASGVAVIRAVYAADDPHAVVMQLLAACRPTDS